MRCFGYLHDSSSESAQAVTVAPGGTVLPVFIIILNCKHDESHCSQTIMYTKWSILIITVTLILADLNPSSFYLKTTAISINRSDVGFIKANNDSAKVTTCSYDTNATDAVCVYVCMCVLTHSAIWNCSSHFFFSSLVLKNKSYPHFP